MKKFLLVMMIAAMASPAPLSARKKKKSKGVDTTLVSKLKADDWARTIKGARRLNGMFPVYLNQKDGKLYFELADSVMWPARWLTAPCLCASAATAARLCFTWFSRETS